MSANVKQTPSLYCRVKNKHSDGSSLGAQWLKDLVLLQL